MPRTPRKEFDQRGVASGLGVLETYGVNFQKRAASSRAAASILSDSDIRSHLRMKITNELQQDAEQDLNNEFSMVTTTVDLVPNNPYRQSDVLYSTPHHQLRAAESRTFTTRWKESNKAPPAPTPFGTSHRLTSHMGYIPSPLRNKPSQVPRSHMDDGLMSPTRAQFDRVRKNAHETMSPQKLRRRHVIEKRRGELSEADYNLL